MLLGDNFVVINLFISFGLWFVEEAREYINSVHIDYRKNVCVCLHFSSTKTSMLPCNNFLVINLFYQFRTMGLRKKQENISTQFI